GLFAMAARDATDPDLWWHLATGRFIVQHRSVPHVDPFSYTSAGTPWIAHEWLTDVLLYELHRTGWAGLIVLFAAVISIAFFLLYLRCGSNVYVAGVATLISAFATRPTWGVRPQVLSLLLTSLWLLLLERSERNPKILWWTVPLTLLWVNLHAGFALGLLVYGLFLLGEWMESRLDVRQNPAGLLSSTRESMQLPALILTLDVLLVPLNPNGLKLYWYPLETLRSSAMQNYIAEWASPNFHHAEYLPFLLIVLALFAMAGWQRLDVRLRDLLLLLVGLFAALRSIRLIPLFVLIAIPIISREVSKWLRARPGSEAQRKRLALPVRTILNASIVVAMAAFAGIHTAQVIRHEPQSEMQQFPERAAAFLQAHSLAGPIFNNYDWGGYLVWKLYSSLRVFIDGRADVYGDQLLHDFATIYDFKDDWQQTLQRWHIQCVLVPPGSALATGLRNAPGWTVSFEDAQAVVLTRSPAPQTNSKKRPQAVASSQAHHELGF
ncbi:MAG: hypothetical protein WA824_06200, partial [Candidatus Sulfotelmatobacter sp.]